MGIFKVFRESIEGGSGRGVREVRIEGALKYEFPGKTANDTEALYRACPRSPGSRWKA